MIDDYKPGDVIEHWNAARTVTKRYVVMDPPRTSRGKLRLRTPSGGYMTTWWDKGRLPKRYEDVHEAT